MQHNNTLTRHTEIQAWVHDRRGTPALTRVSDRYGQIKPRLAIRFSRPSEAPSSASLDDGVSPVSWTAWFAELDRQQLALRVSDETGYEFVPRKTLN